MEFNNNNLTGYDLRRKSFLAFNLNIFLKPISA